MNQSNHAIIWIDHSEAKVYRFSGNTESEVQLHAHTSLQRLHHRRDGWEAGGNPPDDTEFFRRVVGTLDQTAGTVVTGPGNAKLALKTFIDNLHPNLASHVFTVETSDRPGDEALVDLGRRYFQSNPFPTPQAAPNQTVS